MRMLDLKLNVPLLKEKLKDILINSGSTGRFEQEVIVNREWIKNSREGLNVEAWLDDNRRGKTRKQNEQKMTNMYTKRDLLYRVCRSYRTLWNICDFRYRRYHQSDRHTRWQRRHITKHIF